MLKAEPLTVEKLNKYGINHLNNYVEQVNNIGTATSDGRVAYYSSDVCGYYNRSRIVTGCTNDYNDSDIKYILDKWSDDMLNDTDLVNDKGYKIRLITLDEVINLGYEWGKKCEHCYEGSVKTSNAPNWLYNSNMVWAMTPSEKDNTHVWFIYHDGALLDSSIFSDYHSIYNGYGLVRPVITIKKSSLN